jgi:CheY-like chemotaxis protein
MPGLSGWDVAQVLRQSGHDRAAIVMISANANEPPASSEAADVHDDYLLKPVDLQNLLDKLGALLSLDWTYRPMQASPLPAPALLTPLAIAERLDRRHIDELRQLGRIGYVRGIQAKLDEIEKENPAHRLLVTQIRSLVTNFELDRFMHTIEALHAGDA